MMGIGAAITVMSFLGSLMIALPALLMFFNLFFRGVTERGA